MIDPVWLRSPSISVGLLPALGGRIVSVHALGREWLWRNPALIGPDLTCLRDPAGARHATTLGDWWNWGGDKSWPAPQGWSTEDEWPGPPDPILDAGEYDAEGAPDGLSCRMVSRPDPRTGLQVSRWVRLDASRATMTVHTTMVNVSDRPRTWACWTVTQVEVEGPARGATVRVGYEHDAPEPVVMFSPLGTPRVSEWHSDHVVIPVEDVVGKLGFPGATGWIEFRSGDLALRQSFAVEPDAGYPDGGSRVELWMQYPTEQPLASLQGLSLDARLVELECLSPLRQLAPGEETSLEVEWAFSRT